MRHFAQLVRATTFCALSALITPSMAQAQGLTFASSGIWEVETNPPKVSTVLCLATTALPPIGPRDVAVGIALGRDTTTLILTTGRELAGPFDRIITSTEAGSAGSYDVVQVMTAPDGRAIYKADMPADSLVRVFFPALRGRRQLGLHLGSGRFLLPLRGWGTIEHEFRSCAHAAQEALQ